MYDDISPQEKLDLFRYLRPNEIRHCRLRRAFMKDRDTLRRAVDGNDAIDWRELSVRCGYQPDTLASLVSDAMVVRQKRYNFKGLTKALRAMGIEPQPELVEYEKTFTEDEE